MRLNCFGKQEEIHDYDYCNKYCSKETQDKCYKLTMKDLNINMRNFRSDEI